MITLQAIKSIEQAVHHAIRELLRNDYYLLEQDVGERAISHRLAFYLEMEKEFNDLHVDCEYNRDLSKPKKLPHALIVEAVFDETRQKTVIPDIIVHKRGRHDDNLIVIEMKTTTNCTHEGYEFDKRKLIAFRQCLNYSHALFLKFNTGSKFETVSSAQVSNYSIEWIDD